MKLILRDTRPVFREDHETTNDLTITHGAIQLRITTDGPRLCLHTHVRAGLRVVIVPRAGNEFDLMVVED